MLFMRCEELYMPVVMNQTERKVRSFRICLITDAVFISPDSPYCTQNKLQQGSHFLKRRSRLLFLMFSEAFYRPEITSAI